MKRRNLPLTKNVMAPRTKGFVTSAMALREKLDAVYNFTLYYPDGIPSLWQLIGGDVKDVVLYVKRTPIEELPQEESEIENWVSERYVEKDQFLDAIIDYSKKNPNPQWNNETIKSFGLPFV